MTTLWGVRKDGRLLTGYGTVVGATSVPAIAALYKVHRAQILTAPGVPPTLRRARN